jgi:hypothetical protein
MGFGRVTSPTYHLLIDYVLMRMQALISSDIFVCNTLRSHPEENKQTFPVLKGSYTDKKENQIFLIYREIQSGAVAKSYSYMTNGLLIYGEIFSYFPYILGSPMTLQLLHSEFPYI